VGLRGGEGAIKVAPESLAVPSADLFDGRGETVLIKINLVATTRTVKNGRRNVVTVRTKLDDGTTREIRSHSPREAFEKGELDAHSPGRS
jgi:hypothetical protein